MKIRYFYHIIISYETVSCCLIKDDKNDDIS